MKELLIFGDSYAAPYEDRYVSNKRIFDQHLRMLSYHDILARSTQFHNIKNFAVPGCGLYYQFQKFLENYKSIEQVVLWFVTNPGRLYHPELGHIAGLNTAEIIYQKALDTRVKKFAEAAINYYLYCFNEDQANFEHSLILKEILAKAPNVILIPCFTQSLPSDLNPSSACLLDISIIEQEAFGSKFISDLTKDCYDIRKNHLTEENHKVLASKILYAVNNNTSVNLNLNDFTIPKLTCKSKYFIK